MLKKQVLCHGCSYYGGIWCLRVGGEGFNESQDEGHNPSAIAEFCGIFTGPSWTENGIVSITESINPCFGWFVIVIVVVVGVGGVAGVVVPLVGPTILRLFPKLKDIFIFIVFLSGMEPTLTTTTASSPTASFVSASATTLAFERYSNQTDICFFFFTRPRSLPEKGQDDKWVFLFLMNDRKQ